MLLFPPFSQSRRVRDSDSHSASPYLLLVSLGIILIAASYHIPEKIPFIATGKRLLEELGVVLVSVWGVSLFYEKFLALRHFHRFHENLRSLIRQGETNAAVCESLGILEIHVTRRSYEDKHSFSREAPQISTGDLVRITGRSLIFSMYGWRDLKKILENGATLQLCLIDPSIRESPLNYLSGYSPEETDFAIHRFLKSVKPWLESAKPPGSVEIRFHGVHLLDSYLEIVKPNYSRSAWDLNFGEGTEERRVFYIDGLGPLGRNLSDGRYTPLWNQARVAFLYRNGAVTVNEMAQTPIADSLQIAR